MVSSTLSSPAYWALQYRTCRSPDLNSSAYQHLTAWSPFLIILYVFFDNIPTLGWIDRFCPLSHCGVRTLLSLVYPQCDWFYAISYAPEEALTRVTCRARPPVNLRKYHMGYTTQHYTCNRACQIKLVYNKIVYCCHYPCSISHWPKFDFMSVWFYMIFHTQ